MDGAVLHRHQVVAGGRERVEGVGVAVQALDVEAAASGLDGDALSTCAEMSVAVTVQPRSASQMASPPSVATLMDQAGLSARGAADQLGHAKPSMTTDVYFGRAIADTGAADVLESLA
jgi:hypothetical protein